MRKTKYTLCFQDLRLELYKGCYANRRIALELMEGGDSFLMLTVNIPEARLRRGEFVVKDWSENYPYMRDILRCGLFEDTGRRVATGFVRAPIWRFREGVKV
jgi:hypothetical protein